MIKGAIIGIALILFFFALTSAILAENCSRNFNKKNEFNVNKDLRMKVIDNLQALDEKSIDFEIKTVGKYYADIKITELNAPCSPIVYTNITDETVSKYGDKYIYQFKYSMFVSPFDDTFEGDEVKNYFLFKKIKQTPMYFEFSPIDGYWEITNVGVYFSI
jgi:hypothetical protein